MVGKSAKERRKHFQKIPVLDFKSLKDEFDIANIQEDHARTVSRYVVKNKVQSFDEIPNLPKAAYPLLNEKFSLLTSRIRQEQNSADGATTKLLVELYDGATVECVLMRYGTVEFSSFPEHLQLKSPEGHVEFKSTSRATLCVSSQVGCQMGCTFCSTGTMGLLGNLTAGEILEQLYHANMFLPVRNVVFMGMGEPLDNYEEVVEAIRGMIDVRRFNMNAQRVSVSTVGVPARIRQLARDVKGVCLALSLHAPNQETREELVPSGKSAKLGRILEAVDYFIKLQKEYNATLKKRQTVLIQYCLIADTNDSVEAATELCQLLDSRRDFIMLNIIPYNPSVAAPHFRAPSQEQVDKFAETVRSHGIKVTIRQELGQDIAGACGQLAVKAANADAPSFSSPLGLFLVPEGVLYYFLFFAGTISNFHKPLGYSENSENRY